jgi:hypothetical protein
MELDENSKYWERIRKNIKKLYKDDKIEERYSFESFCNDFIPEDEPLENKETDKCICDHDIIHNFKYKHKDRNDYFILGSCCIKKFSTVYKELRKCKECRKDIRRNEDNLCGFCRGKEERKRRRIEKYKERCKCKECGETMKDDTYKKCYSCKFGVKKYNKCKDCKKDKKEDTFMRCYTCNMKKKEENLIE